ncbi:MAG: serine hydrolase [Lachnospiraceae bacterium]|nr:serine hydrolase [Lachnospiraceae bacterium]
MKNKIITALLVFIIAFESVSIDIVKAKLPTVNAKSYVIMDASNENVIYKKNPNMRIYPASTTKILTAMCVLDELDLDKKIKFTSNMQKVSGSFDIAHIYIPIGTVYTVKEYLYMMLMASDASSAAALAIGSSGSISAFSKKMNKKVKELGLKNSKFDNPIGLDIGNNYNNIYSTAKDFAILSRKAMSYPTIRKIARTKSYKVAKSNKKASFKVNNTNLFLHYYDYDKTSYTVIGLKTGYTNAAKYCMVVIGRDTNNHELIASYFGASNNSLRYSGIRDLLNYSFKRVKNGKLKLKIDFWDTRYSEQASLIRKYAYKGVLKANADGRFYPNRKVTAKQFSNYIKKIAKVNISFSTSKVSVKKFVEAYNDYYTANLTAKELKANKIFPDSMKIAKSFKISKAQAVYIANKLKSVKKNASSDARANASSDASTNASSDASPNANS